MARPFGLIQVWSVKEGEQRFDTHVDKLLNYIRFWQASGESEKTAIRVRTRQQQMVLAGEYRGGLILFGFDAVYLGRVNKKGQPVRDLVRNDEEAAIKAEVYHKIVDEGLAGFGLPIGLMIGVSRPSAEDRSGRPRVSGP